MQDGQTDGVILMLCPDLFVCIAVRIMFVFIPVVRLLRTVLWGDIGIV